MIKSTQVVSIIIPTFNRCKALEKAVSSILKQTYQNFEIIIVDDGSSDNTWQYLKSLTDKRIYSIRFQANQGGNAARNAGINRSKGAYIAFCDDDDSWDPKKLELQIALSQKDNVDISYSGANIYDNSGKFTRYVFNHPKYRNTFKAMMYDNYIGSTSSVIIKREILEKTAGFDTHLPALQDWDIYIRLTKNGAVVKGINKPLVNYHIIDEKRSITANHTLFREGANLLLCKYKNESHFKLLRRRIKIITIKRIIKSRNFFSGWIRFNFRKLFKNIHTDIH